SPTFIINIVTFLQPWFESNVSKSYSGLKTTQVTMKLVGLDEDVLIYIVLFLEPPDILRLSEVHMQSDSPIDMSAYHLDQCLFTPCHRPRGYPFPSTLFDELSTKELTYHTISSYHLARRWRRGIQGRRRMRYISGTSGTSVSDVQYLPGHNDSLMLMISKSVWSVLSIWYIGSEKPHKVCEWSPRGAIFSGIAVNSDSRSEATIALALHLNEQVIGPYCENSFVKARDWVTVFFARDARYKNFDMKPVTMNGDILALNDDFSQTAIWNWRTGSYGLLRHLPEDPSVFQCTGCSCTNNPFPRLYPHDADGTLPVPYETLAHHSFGWLTQNVSISARSFPDRRVTLQKHASLSILVRGESDDPWASDIFYLELYTFEPNPGYIPDDTSPANISPYLFPPRLSNKVACLRGSLTCRQIVLGRLGTAVWIQPRDRFAGGLLADIPSHLVPATNVHESLIVAVFPGSLRSEEEGKVKEGSSVVVGKKIFGNEFNTSWTSLDYDEVNGRIALASSFGRVTIPEL
ncbi:hypothetical protein CVT25_005204, partial [Psilocybe cyanescens]